MTTFYRGNFSHIFLNIRASEALGLLQTDYLEDYDGVNGQVSLYHIDSGVRYPMPVVSVPSDTPDTPNDSFRGSYLLSGLPNGNYQMQFRARDVGGNYVISGAFSAPTGTEKFRTLTFSISKGSGLLYVIDIGALVIRGALAVSRLVRRIESIIKLGG